MRFLNERMGVSMVSAITLGLIARPGVTAVLEGGGVAVTAILTVILAASCYRLLPTSLDGALGRRRGLGALWVLLAAVTLVQTARLSAHLEDPDREWWLTTKHPFWTEHMCSTAYFYAADLNRQGESNVYDKTHYPAMNPGVEVRTTVANLSPDDPYQYPPQFLLLPRLAIALSNDLLTIRAVWFTLNALVFLLIAIGVARWFGGSAGRMALWLVPLCWISVPSMLNFQYGQFHLTTIALAVAAFLAFERGRSASGGALLAASVLAKGFPALVLIPLVLRRQWRAVAWTGVWSIGFTVIAFAVIGPEPFEAFLTHHLPNLRTGDAFAFEKVWPELRALLFAGNVSPLSMIQKFGDLGVPGMSEGVARAVQVTFSLSLIGVAVLTARLRDARQRAIGWFALLNLAAMTSPAAWGDYVPVGTLWMLTLMTSGTIRVHRMLLASAGLFSFLLPGVVPLGSFPGPAASMAISILGTLLLIVVNGRLAIGAAPLRVGVGVDPRRPAIEAA